MTSSVPDKLRGREELLDPEKLKPILESCSTGTRNALSRAKITCLALLLILPEETLLEIPNLGDACIRNLREALELHEYMVGEASALFPDIQDFFKSDDPAFASLSMRHNFVRQLSSLKPKSKILDQLRGRLAELYEIEIALPPPLPTTATAPDAVPPAPSKITTGESGASGQASCPDIVLFIPVPENLATRLEKSPGDFTDLTGFCQDAFGNAIRHHICPDQAPPPLNPKPVPEEYVRIEIPITLCEKWKETFQPLFLRRIAKELSYSAALRDQILAEFGPKMT